MKKWLVCLVVICCLRAEIIAQQQDSLRLEAAVEQLKDAMVNADSAVLAELTHPLLTYGHSGGKVDDRASFIRGICSGSSDFVSIQLSGQQVLLSGKTAIVRHKLDAVTNDGGKPGEVHLRVLLVWQKMKSGWKLLARQAVKQS